MCHALPACVARRLGGALRHRGEAKTSFHLGLYAPLPVYPAPYYAAPYPYYAPPAYPAYEPECRTVWDREDVWDEEEEDWAPREEPRRICD